MSTIISPEFAAANNLRDRYISEVAMLKMNNKREAGSKADITIQVLEQCILDIETEILNPKGAEDGE